MIKPKLIKSAEDGYSRLRVKIDSYDKEAKEEKLKYFSDTIFINYLRENLEGVEVEFEQKWVESLLFKNMGSHEYSLIFSW